MRMLRVCAPKAIAAATLAMGLLAVTAAQMTWAASPAESCGALARVALPDTRVQAATLIAAGQFSSTATVVPANATAQQLAQAATRAELFRSLPAFCRVTAQITTSPSSSVAFEAWLPMTGWNGQFIANGYSFYGGNMDPVLMADALRGGYASATTDGGGGGVRGGSFLLNQPEKLRDVGDRALHETVVKAKALINAYYNRSAELSYFAGCGGEGRQGLAAAQRFPEDFDGIAVGGLAHDTSHFAFAQVWVWQAAHEGEASFLPPSKLPALHEAAVNACDALDGAKDQLIGNPERCTFDPAVMQCRGVDNDQCLTTAQVATARKVYATVTNPRTGQKIFGPLMPGSERSWVGTVTGASPSGYAIDFFKYLVFRDPDWDVLKRPLNYDSDVTRAEQVDGTLNPVDPDLSRFVRRGGKLLIYGGWSDVAIPPGANTDYYRSVVAKMGASAADSVKLVMVPGMGHCPGGFGPPVYEFEPLSILKGWREKGTAPDPIVARVQTNGLQEREVLACAWPQVPMYRGEGDMKSAASFACRLAEGSAR